METQTMGQTAAHHAHHRMQRGSPTETLNWNSAMLVGHAPIDEAHEEFAEVVMALRECNQHNALACLMAVEAHVLSHFETEHVLMKQTDFPAMECHLDEHQKVINAVQQVNALAQAGEVGLSEVKRLAQALIDWFPGHVDYLDSALSAWINKKLHGGAPVVLRRDMQLPVSTAAL